MESPGAHEVQVNGSAFFRATPLLTVMLPWTFGGPILQSSAAANDERAVRAMNKPLASDALRGVADNRLMGALARGRPYRSHEEYARRLAAAPPSGQGVSSLPRLHDTDMVELHHLRSFPSLSVDTAAGPFSIQSSGLVLRSISSDDVVVLEYRPVNYSAAFLPMISPTESDGSTYDGSSRNGRAAGGAGAGDSNDTVPLLEWDRRAVISYNSFVDTSYWQQSTFVGMLNGVVYENYVKWLTAYQAHDSAFEPYSICSGADELSCFVTCQTWETFLADSLLALSKLEVNMHSILPPRASEIQMLSFSEPVLVTLLSPSAQANASAADAASQRNYLLRKNSGLKVHAYFRALVSCMQNYQLEELSSALRSCMSEKDGFLYKGGLDYYRVRPRHPFVLTREYLQVIPPAAPVKATKSDLTDLTIALGLLLFAVVGLCLSLYRLKLLDFFVNSAVKIIRRRSPTSSSATYRRAAPSGQAQGEVLQRVRGALFGGTAAGTDYERVATDEVEMAAVSDRSSAELSSSSSKAGEGAAPVEGPEIAYELHVDRAAAASEPSPAYRSVINFRPLSKGPGDGWRGRHGHSSAPSGKGSPGAILPITAFT